MTKKVTSRTSRPHVLEERVIDLLDGPVLAVRYRRSVPEDHRDVTLTVQVYRAVVGTTEQAEILSPCGHEVPRFDLTQGFQVLRRYPRSRLCPHCAQHPQKIALEHLERPDDSLEALQIASDWGAMTKEERDTARVYLQELRSLQPDLPDIADWQTLRPAQRFQIAQAGEALAGAFGLTFHEWLSMKYEPASPITAAGLKWLQASGLMQKNIDSWSREEEAEGGGVAWPARPVHRTSS